jgi:hypothetical protein
MRFRNPMLATLCFALVLGGCAVGYNSTLFFTKSNIGIDAETKPPTAEISIARREGVITPRFEGGQTPPVLASFRANANPFSRFFFGVKSTFAGGDAAVALAQGPGGPQTGHNSELCLSEKPGTRSFLGSDVSVPEKGHVDPLFFATDTVLGLKLAWSGTTGQIPDTIRLGFNRKEFAWAPLTGTDVAECTIPGTQQGGVFAIWMPAFLAVLDNDVQVGAPAQTETKWLQYFATGTSATALANLDPIRRVMMERIEPEAFQTGTYDPTDPTVACIETWLKSDNDHPRQLKEWWSGKQLPGFAVLQIKTKEYGRQRQDFIREKQIQCTP